MITHFQWEDTFGFEVKLVSYGLGQAFQLFGPDGRRIVLKLEDNGYVNLFKAMKEALEKGSASVVIHKFKVSIAQAADGSHVLSIDGNIIDVVGVKNEGAMAVFIGKNYLRDVVVPMMMALDEDGQKLWEAGGDAKLGLYLSHDRGLFFKRTTVEGDVKTFKLTGYPAEMLSDSFVPLRGSIFLTNPWYTLSVGRQAKGLILGRYFASENGLVYVKMTPSEFEELKEKLQDYFFS